MRVVIIGGVSNRSDQIEGGVESVVNNLVAGFEKFPEHQFILLGKKIETKNYGNISYRSIPFMYKSLGLTLNYLLFRNKIVNQIKIEYNPDIIHFQGTIPNLFLINKTIKFKSVVTQHGILREEYKYQIGILKKIKFLIKIFSESFLVSRIKNMIYISEYNRKYMLSRFPSLRNGNSKLIYNPVNPFYYQNNIVEMDNSQLYFVGEIKKRKGLHDLLSSLKKTYENGISYTLHVIGGFKEKEYEREIRYIVNKNKYLKENVIFHGWKKPDEIIEIAKNCVFFVLPSYQETLPVSLAEAMALGKVVIATDLPGIKEMIEDKREGRLFRKGDVVEFTNILKYCFDNPSILKNYSVQARQKAEVMFSSVSITQQTLDFYGCILNEK